MDKTLFETYQRWLLVIDLINLKEYDEVKKEADAITKLADSYISSITPETTIKSIYDSLEENNFGDAKTQIKGLLKYYVEKSFLDFKCSKNWYDDLTPTEDESVRFCGGCNKNVYLVKNNDDYLKHKLAGHCVGLAFKPNESLFTYKGGCDIQDTSQVEIGIPMVIRTNI